MKQIISILMSLIISSQGVASHAGGSPEPQIDHTQLDDLNRMIAELEELKKQLQEARASDRFVSHTFIVTAAVAFFLGARALRKEYWTGEHAHIANVQATLGGAGALFHLYRVKVKKDEVKKFEALVQSKLEELAAAQDLMEEMPTTARIETLLAEIADLEAQIAKAESEHSPDKKKKQAAAVIAFSLVGFFLIHKALNFGGSSYGESGGGPALAALVILVTGGLVLVTGGAGGFSMRVDYTTLEELKEALQLKRLELEATQKLLESLK